MAKPTKIKKTIKDTLAWAEKQDAKVKAEAVKEPQAEPLPFTNKTPDTTELVKDCLVQAAKMGRPTKYKDAETDRAAQMLASKGFTDLEMAAGLMITESTFYLWKDDHPNFSEAITKGKADIDDMVVKSLFNRATGCSIKETKVHVTKDGDVVETEVNRNFPPDPTSMIFWLKNRRPKEWRDKHEVDFISPLTIQMGDKDQKTL